MKKEPVEFDPFLQRTVGGCFLIERIGRSDLCAVYEANQVRLDRRVAVKLMLHPLAEDKTFVDRFTQEASVAGKDNHANIAWVFDSGVEMGIPYIIMELIRGRSLAKLLEEGFPLAPEQAAGYICQALRALDTVHGTGEVHGNLKPSNLFVNEEGSIKVTDFGARRAAETRSSLTESQPVYTSPEQCRGELPTEKSDIFSLGACFYLALTGEHPFLAGLQNSESFTNPHCSPASLPPTSKSKMKSPQSSCG